MLPILLDLGFIKIYTFGVFLVLAFFWASFYLWKNVSMTSHKEDEVFDGIFFALFGAVLIGRIQFVALHFSDFGFNILKFILMNGYPGIGIMGFILGFLVFLGLFVSMRKIEFGKLIDYTVPPLFLALAIGKLGAFFAGTEIGSQTGFFLSLAYKNFDGMRHMTPLYESIAFFAGSYFSYKVLRSIRRNALSDGFNLKFFLWYFSLVAVAFDPIKSFRQIIQGISFDLVVGGLCLLTASIYMLYYFRKFLSTRLFGFLSFSKKKK
ncbi:prolipoprotein diacylglyceryl transferase [Candidatus Woesebacteria bacterium]|nr:prolipoprotein diacylglyceryl transferase [Candidatus Woesebacteria bacterium]